MHSTDDPIDNDAINTTLISTIKMQKLLYISKMVKQKKKKIMNAEKRKKKFESIRKINVDHIKISVFSNHHTLI